MIKAMKINIKPGSYQKMLEAVAADIKVQKLSSLPKGWRERILR